MRKTWESFYLLQFKSQSIKIKDGPYIGLIKENSIEFQVQSIYFIYTRLIVHTTLNLAYFKEYVLNMLYGIIILEPFISFYVIL